MLRILVTDEINETGLSLLRAAEDAQVDVRMGLSAAALQACIGEYDAVITRSGTALDAAFFRAAAGRLKVAARAGVGLENVDIPAATAAGVMVMNIPEVNALAAAELTFALMLALVRHVPQANARLRQGVWERGPFLGSQLAGKTLGIVGLGRIGGLVASRARAFEMRVLAFDPYVPEDVAEGLRVELVETLDELLAQSDFVSLHCQLTDETRNLLGAAQFAKMKHGARLINTARGGLVDEQALIAALESGQLAGAGVDVFVTETGEGASDLARRADVVATPHLGASTIEAQEDVSIRIAHQVLDALRGTGYRNVVNLPFAGDADYRAIAPYMALAEKIGSLQMQLAMGRGWGEMSVQVAYRGAEIGHHAKPLTVALLKGLLTPILGDSVNYVNAPQLAAERGLAVNLASLSGAEEYANVILCRLTNGDEKRLVAGTVLARGQARIVRMDDMPMDALPAGYVLVVRSRDVPGVIGQTASLLGAAGVNIAEYRLGRDYPGGTALSFINLDDAAPDEVLAGLRAMKSVLEVKQVKL
ncbi:MAG: phosphoglycerate dehydrogenase [Anaerolineales bacterium]